LTKVVAGLIDHQHRIVAAKMLDHVATQVLTHAVVIPRCPQRQVLHRIRADLPGVLGDRPAVRPLAAGRQAGQVPSTRT